LFETFVEIRENLGLESSSSIYAAPVSWDAAHLFHLAVDDMM